MVAINVLEVFANTNAQMICKIDLSALIYNFDRFLSPFVILFAHILAAAVQGWAIGALFENEPS